ncbi:MAG: FtsH protease activity modulator HflK [Burkholderiales bacterium]
MALNDPQWGRKNNDGPPDLDELFRRFKRKLSELAGNKPPTAGNGGGSGPPRSLPGGAWMIVGILAAIWLMTGFYIVDASSKGVVLRFGKLQEITEPGPRWHLPWPIESKEVVNVSALHTADIGFRGSSKASKVPEESLMLTDDLNIVDVQFAVQYLLIDPKAVLFNNRSYEANAEDLVRQAAETATRQIVGQSKMDYVLNEGRTEVAQRSAKLMQDILDRYISGIKISRVNMQNAQPPEQVQQAFDDANKANQDRERQINEGQAYANDILPKAEGTASRLRAEANGYQQRIIASAEGDASRFKQVLTEYRKAPAVMRERLYLDMMQQVLSNTSKIVVDQKASNNMLYLPLDKLMQPASEPAVAAIAQPPATRPEDQLPATEAGQRSRDLFRSRERESR